MHYTYKHNACVIVFNLLIASLFFPFNDDQPIAHIMIPIVCNKSLIKDMYRYTGMQQNCIDKKKRIR